MRVSATIAPVGDLDLFFFSGVAGDAVSIEGNDEESGTPIFELYGPDGILIDQDSDFFGEALIETTLSQTGNHGIVVYEQSEDQTLSYSLTYNCVGSCPPTTLPPLLPAMSPWSVAILVSLMIATSVWIACHRTARLVIGARHEVRQ